MVYNGVSIEIGVYACDILDDMMLFASLQVVTHRVFVDTWTRLQFKAFILIL